MPVLVLIIQPSAVTRRCWPALRGERWWQAA